MVVFKDKKCIMHVGCMVPGHKPGTAKPGPICRESQRKGAANYLANLALFPGKFRTMSAASENNILEN